MLRLYPIYLCLFILGCTRDIAFPDNSGGGVTGNPSPCDSLLISVNEIAPGGSANEPADWVEVYNPKSQMLSMVAGEWAVSDDPADPSKYLLPALTLGPKEFIVIMCDDQNMFSSGVVHTNFKLSSTQGDHFGIYKKVSGQWKLMDGFTFTAQSGPATISRKPDGCGKWFYNTLATYKQSNG